MPFHNNGSPKSYTLINDNHMNFDGGTLDFKSNFAPSSDFKMSWNIFQKGSEDRMRRISEPRPELQHSDQLGPPKAHNFQKGYTDES